ncbi:hypothetical protein [Sphingomonas sp. CCH9-H8]|nr:hypothetical protein [Sphingomonas sp. CCH9-H8]
MSEPRSHPAILPAPPKRRHIDGLALVDALQNQQRRDIDEEPASLLTTMGAVRLLKPLIADRRTRGWTDPMIATLLGELGVPISAETLRTYRSRLAREDMSDGSAPSVADQLAAGRSPVPLAAQTADAAPGTIAPAADAAQAITPSPSPPPVTVPAKGTETGAKLPRFNTAVDLDDCV